MILLIVYFYYFSFLFQTTTTNNCRIYGLESVQYINTDQNVSPTTSFTRNVAVDERMTRIEEYFNAMKKFLEENNVALKLATNMPLRINGIDHVTLMLITAPPLTAQSDGSSSTVANHVSRIHVNLVDLPNQNLQGIFEENKRKFLCYLFSLIESYQYF